MKRIKSSFRAARGFFNRAVSSEAAPPGSLKHSTNTATPALDGGPASAISMQRLLAQARPSPSFAAGGVFGFGVGGAFAYHIQGLERVSPSKAVASTAPQRQEGWSPEQLNRINPDPAPGPSAMTPWSIADAAAKAAPAVVNVMVKPAPGSEFPNSSSCSGSGFILEAGGLVVTNAHVVVDALDGHAPAGSPTQGARPIIVSLQDGRTFEGRVCSLDKESDLALVRIEAAEPLPVAELGSSSGLRVGEWILALGSPLHLQNTVTAGIVSCVERKAAELGLAPSGGGYIQMDVAISQGNSGGPIVNLGGQVVGISHTKALMSDVSFAIPIDAAKHVIKQLEVQGRVKRPHVGMKLLQLNAANAAQLRARDAAFPSVTSGILVPDVTPNSPAHAAGLQAGDVIVGFAGGNTEKHELTTAALVRCLGNHVGVPMQLQVLRLHGPPLTLEVTPKEAAS